MTKIGEYKAVDIIRLFELLSNKFPNYEFFIEEGRSYDWFSLYSSCENDIVHETVEEYFRNKHRKVKSDENSMLKAFPQNIPM